MRLAGEGFQLSASSSPAVRVDRFRSGVAEALTGVKRGLLQAVRKLVQHGRDRREWARIKWARLRRKPPGHQGFRLITSTATVSAQLKVIHADPWPAGIEERFEQVERRAEEAEQRLTDLLASTRRGSGFVLAGLACSLVGTLLMLCKVR